jgi:hypothetical protein
LTENRANLREESRIAQRFAGWGINFAHQGNVIFATWFTYGHDKRREPCDLALHPDKTGGLRRAEAGDARPAHSSQATTITGVTKMNNFKIVVASMGGVAILSLAQFACAADVRGQANNSTPTVTVPSGAMSGMDGSNGFDTVLAGAPTVTVPSGAMSGMDGSNGFDTVLEANVVTPRNTRDGQYRVALAECAAMASTQQAACRTAAQSAYEGSKSAPSL